MVAPAVEIVGERLSVHFTDFSESAYPLFLRVKALPEYDLEYLGDESYRITAPARFASMLGVEDQDTLSPGHIFGGENDCGRTTEVGIYIYGLIDPVTNRIRYIGKSTRPRGRLSDHCNERSPCHRTHWIQSLLAQGKRPLLIVLERLAADADWQAVERQWIAFGREQGWPLVNGTDGGDGVCGLSPEARERIATAWIGRRHRAESLAKIGRASRGRRHTAEHKARMSQKMQGREITPTHRRNLSLAVQKISDEQVAEIRERLAAGELIKDLAAEFGVCADTISDVKHRRGCYGQ